MHKMLQQFLQLKKGFLILILLLATSFAFAQQKMTITGKVTGDNNAPLAGVSVTVKGTSNGTITNSEGSFTIQANRGATLVVSYVGYGSQEVVANKAKLPNIQLVQSSSTLGEVVLIGYGSQRKKDVTGAISTIKMEDAQIPSVPSFDEMLQGKVAGAQISQTSGGPGGGNINVVIRGISSITGGNSPLYVIDGFPISGTGASSDLSSFGGNLYSSEGMANNVQSRINPLASINPSDIASIDILKDASATAIYGSRGANGVVIITTKRGNYGKAKISVDASYGLQSVEHKLHLLNSQEYAQYVAEGRDNAYVFSGGSLSDPNSMRPASQRVRPEFRDPSSIKTNTDWQDVIFRVAPVTNLQLSVNGGNDKTKIYSSLGYMDQQGIILTSDYKRFTMRTNMDSKLSDKLKVGSSITGSYGYGRFPDVEGHYGTGGVLAQALSASPTIPVYDSTGKPYFNQADVTDGLGWLANPLDLLSGYSDNRTSTQVLWNNFAEYTIIDGLTLKSTLGIQYEDQGIKIWRSSKIPNYTNLNYPATAGATRISTIDWLNENTLNYKKSFNKSNIDALVGFTAQKDRNERLSAGASDFPTENVTYLSAGIVNAGTNILSEWSLLSLLGRLNYSYEGKFLFTATFRRDGSSRFGSNNRWGNFPSFAVGYNLADEPFMKQLSFVNNLKLRASYGFSGNNQIGNYSYVGLLSPTNYVANDSRIPGLIPTSLSNVDLGWEKSRQINLGFDLGMFNNRVSLTFNAYKDHKTNLLLDVQLPAASGFNSATQNIGDIENKGIEIGLNTVNFTGGAFKWTTDFTFSANKNKVLKLATEGGRIANNAFQITEVGQPIASFYMLHAIGVFMSPQEVAGSALQNPKTQPGDLKFEDVNGDGVINSDDRKIVGSPWPDYTWGFSNSFSYKNLSLSVSLVGSHGSDTYFEWGVGVLNGAGVQNQLADISLGRYVSESQPGDGFQPRAIRNNYAMAFSTTSHFLFNSSYVRIKNVNLAYHFPKTFSSKLGLSEFSVYVDGSNLYTFTDYPGFDPESSISGSNVAQSGIDYLTYPLARTFTFGLNVTF
ncbi:MAG: SusC/RagA family TonB-linked outer membrane protein [Ginsengibacter sp.]